MSDVTSLSYEEEKKRHIAAMDNIQKMSASHLTVKAEQMISCGANDSKHAVSSPPSSPKLAGQPVSSPEVKTCSLHPTGDIVTPEGTDIVVFLHCNETDVNTVSRHQLDEELLFSPTLL